MQPQKLLILLEEKTRANPHPLRRAIARDPKETDPLRSTPTRDARDAEPLRLQLPRA